MAKYSYEFKKKIVNAYTNNEGGIKFLANKYGVKSSRNILTWVNNFKLRKTRFVLEANSIYGD